MSVVDGKPPRKADQLLQALSKKYEEKARDRDARSSGRNTPTRHTPQGSRERLPSNADQGDTAENSVTSLRTRSARGSLSARSELFSSNARRSPSLDGLRSGRLSENRSPAVRASPNLFEKTRSPARHGSPVQSPGFLEKARKSPSQSPARRQSPSPSPSYHQQAETSPRGPAGRQDSVAADQEDEHREQLDTSGVFGLTSTPTAESPDEIIHDANHNNNQSLIEYDKSLDDHNTKYDTHEDELDIFNSSLETSNIGTTHGLDASFDNSYQETKLNHDDTTHPPKQKYTGSLFGKNKRSNTASERSNLKSRSQISNVNPSDTKLWDRSGDLAEERPESRQSSVSGYSFAQLMAAGSPRSSMAASPLPPRSYAMEKEQADSQLRKLELENSSLKLENKSLKDKFNRSQSQIVHLETKLKTLENEVHKVRSERKKESYLSKQKNAEAEETLQESTREEKGELKRKIELLEVEKESLEKELMTSRKMTDTAIQSSDITKIMGGYKVESSALRDEIKKLKLVLKESENSLDNEAEARKRTTESNKKLAEMNNILKQQLEMDSEGSVADKQVKGIESRLKITEDRLFQERADRAGKLSEIEDKLLNENAKLQVDVKEVCRQLNREREKLRVNEVRLQELKEQQLSLSFLTAGSGNTRRFTATHRAGSDSKKFSPEVTKIVQTIQKESGAQLHEEEEIISYLYNKERSVMNQLNNWKNELQQLKDMHRQIITEGDTRQLLEELQDSRQRMVEVENVLNGEISKLVREKHDNIATVKHGEDKIEGLEAELEYLRIQMKVGGGATHTLGDSSFNGENSEKSSKLSSEVNSLKVKISQLERSLKVDENEISGLHEQLSAKTISLDEAIIELESMRKERSSEESAGDKRQRNIEQLTIQIKRLQSEVSSLKEKNKLLSQAKTSLEARVEELTSEVDNVSVNLMSSTREFETFSSQKSQLELEVSEKAEEINVLKERYESLEGKHIETREDLILNKDHVSRLHRQVDDLQQQLVAKNNEYDNMTSRLHSQEDSYTTTEEYLLSAQKQVDELKTALSLEKLNYNKLKSDAEREAANSKHECSKLSREISALTGSIETLRGQKSELSKDVEVSKVRLAELQARLAEAQSEIASHKEKEKMLSEERDRLTEEKHEAKLQAARIEAEHKQEKQELNRTIQDLKQQSIDHKTSVESMQTSMSFEKERVTSELDGAKKQLANKEKEVARLVESVSTSKADIESKLSRVKELETQLDEVNYKNKEHVDRLNEAIRQRDQQILSFEKSLKELDGESRSKKEMEIEVRRLEDELQERQASESRLKKEVASLTERKMKDQSAITQLKSDAANLEERRSEEVNKLKHCVDKANDEIKQRQNQYEREKMALHDKFNQVSADLKAAEATISVMAESKQSQLSAISSLERKNESLKSQLQDSQVNERLSDQKLANTREQLEETRSRMNKAEDKTAELSASIVKAESEVKIEREKMHYLKSEKEDLESTKLSSEYKVEMYQQEIEALQSEASSLREQLSTQKEMVEGRSRKQSHQLQSQLDVSEKEKIKLQLTNQELSSNLSRLKDQLSSREEDTQRYKQQSLTLEQKLRETEAKLTKYEQSLMSHDDLQDRLNKRNLDLELELSELKNLLTRMEGNSAAHDLESSKIDNLTRAELNRTMTEWSVRLQALLETERGKQKAGGDNNQMHDPSKLKVAELENKLKHEQLMHTVTKNQLKSLEDENMKLRKRLLTTGNRRIPSNKSREEMIREQILQSEMRVSAQMGVPAASRLFGTALLANTHSTRFGLNNTSTIRLSPTKLHRTDNFNGMSVLGSLGFTSPMHDRLNNTLSRENSFGDDDSTHSNHFS